MCVTADKTCIFHKSVMNTRTIGGCFLTVSFVFQIFLKMLKNGLNSTFLGCLTGMFGKVE